MSPVRREIRVLTRLALPVALTQMGMMAIGLVDTRMVGRLGSTELSAVALADVILFGSLILGFGLVMGIDPLVSQAHGAGEGARAGRALQRGIVIGLLASVPILAVWMTTGRLLRLIGQDETLSRIAQVYADAQLFSIAPILVFTAMRQYLQGRGNMTTPLLVVIVANFVNYFLNRALIFGHWGFPALGVHGAGLASGLTRTFMMALLALLLFGRGMHRGAWTPWSRAVFDRAELAKLLRLGGAVSVQFGLEVWAFSCSTAFAGKLPAPSVAAHIIVLRVASFAFMVPLGISHASATRVGNLIGARDPAGAQRAAWIALSMGGGVMLLSAAAFVVLREPLARIFTPDPAVIALCATVFPVAAAFQLFDGTQAVGGGILRGMGTPRPAAVFNLFGYYALALPLAWWLAFRQDAGLRGVWWGLAAGLAVVAACLVAWIARRGPLSRSRTPARSDR